MNKNKRKEEVIKNIEDWLHENGLSIFDVVLDEKYEEFNRENEEDDNEQ